MTQGSIERVLSISLAFILAFASLAWGQVEIGDFTASGSASVGGLPRSISGSKDKFDEYRDVPDTVIVPEIELNIDSKKNDYYLEYDSTKLGRDDQNYRLRLGKYGLWDMQFEWDQIPHLFNLDTAGTPYARNSGTFTLSSKPTNVAQPNPVTCANSAVCQWVNSESHKETLKLIQGFARVNLRYTPTPGWTFNARYGSQNTNGDRAFGTVTNGFTNIVELPEPLDYQTHNIELGGEYAAKSWSLGLKYNGSLFHNNTSTLLWDNPFNISGIGSACVNSVNSTCRGRLDLYPSNQAHTFTLTGTAKLPWQTTFLGTASYGWRLQDDKFLPFTINSAITQPVLLRNSLNGDVRPTMVNMTVVNRYFNHLNLKAFYRYYDFTNKSKTLFLEEGYIRTDTGGPTGVGLKSFPWAYSKQNIGLEPSYKFTNWLTGKLSYGWERMHREQREVLNADEFSLGPTFDIQPNSALLFRISYKRFWRDAPDYDAGRYVVVETEETRDQVRDEHLAALRKVDEAARDRDKVSLFTQFSPFEKLTFHAGFDFTNDVYSKTVVGLKNDINYSPSVGFIYAPLDWLRFFGDYNWDRFDWKLRAMERSGQNVNGCPDRDEQTPDNCPTSLWTSRGREKVNTVSIGTDASLIKNVLTFRLQYGYSQGRSDVRASGNTTPGNVLATDYPTLENRWHELLARLEYTVHKNVALQVGYYFNRYNTKDQGVDIMKKWMGDVDSGAYNSIFLGDNGKRPYEAHVGLFAVKFKF